MSVRIGVIFSRFRRQAMFSLRGPFAHPAPISSGFLIFSEISELQDRAETLCCRWVPVCRLGKRAVFFGGQGM
jgi:hypothetical protein